MNTAQIAAAYIDKLGLNIVPLRPQDKRPFGKEWIELNNSKEATDFYTKHPDCGIGVNLGKSRICSADLDWPEALEIIDAEFGFGFGKLADNNCALIGSAPRIMFRVPDGMNLGYCKLNWTGDDGKSHTVLELRAVRPDDEKQRQDVLPPSIHPDTKKPYEWIKKPSEVGINEPPDWLLNIWKNWEFFKTQLESANPFVKHDKHVKEKQQIATTSGSGLDVANAFDDAHDIEQTLKQYGYKKCGNRYLSPHSETGLPGVHIFDNKCWIHHASDPLCSEDTGRPVGPFDLFTQYEHNGDYKSSTRSAARLLGIEHPLKSIQNSIQSKGSVENLSDTLNDLPVNKEGKIVSSYTAMIAVVSKMKIGYDNFLECPMIQKRDTWTRFDDSDYVDIAMDLEWMNFAGISMPKVKDVVRKVMVMNQFDSAQQWLNGLIWDGVDRCSHLFAKYFDSEQSEYENAVSMYFVSAMAARVLEPGAQCDMVPILLGKQGAGKTSAVKALAPIVDSFTEIDLSTRKDTDLARQLRGKLIGELGELRGLKTKESEWIKAWITRTHEEWTPKFVEMSRVMPRRCVFVGTTNEDEFLVDQTGNRRWLPIKVNNCDIQGIKDDVLQIWAQAASIFKNNGVLWQDVVRLADLHREDHMVYDDAMIDSVRNVLTGHSFISKEFIRLLDIANELFDNRIPSRADQHRIADALRSLGYIRATKRIDGKLCKVFVKQ